MTLTAEQQAVVDSNHPLILVQSCAGSGKTLVLVERIKRLIKDGVDPKEVCAVAYTVNAAHEIQERIGQPIGFCGTLHSLCLSFICQHGNLIGFDPKKLTILDEEAEQEFIAEQCDLMRYKGNQEELRLALRKVIVIAKRLTPAGLLAGRIHQQLRLQHMLTYDAILAYGLQVISVMDRISNNQEGPVFWTGFRHLFVDEVQDASVLDWEIYEALPIENKFCVGDAHQAIFGWRGGASERMIELSRRKDVEAHCLTYNFRAAQEICDFANNLTVGRFLPMKGQPYSGWWLETGGFENPMEEIQRIANVIRSHKGSWAILLRTNDLVDQYSQKLQEAGIKVSTLQRWEPPPDWQKLKLLVALCANPDNEYLAAKWLKLTNREVSAPPGKSLNECVLHIPMGMTVGDLWSGMARQTAELALGTIMLLEETCHTVNPQAPVLDLLQALHAMERQQPELGRCTQCATMTYHQAKGREFDGVILPALEEGIMPMASDDVDELRRVLYVGVTRARRRLFLSWCKSRQGPWEPEPTDRKPSRYFKELGEI